MPIGPGTGLARKPEGRWKSCTMMVDALAALLEPKLDLFARRSRSGDPADRRPFATGGGDCSNPTSGVKVFSTAAYAEPLLTEALPLPTSIPPGDYLLRACNYRTGEQPSNCVQVPFTVTAAAPPVASESRLASPSPSPP